MHRGLTGALAILCTLTALPPADAQPRNPDDGTMLVENVPIERRLTRGEAHRFQLVLAAGEYAAVVVQQRGIDAKVSVQDPAGSVIDEVQDEILREGSEHVELVAATAGTYVVIVRPADGALVPGGYTIRFAERRAATGPDRIMQESRSLRTTAHEREKVARFQEAHALFERALGLAESLHGADDPYVACIVFDLAGNALERQDNAGARALYERAAGAMEKVWGTAHPYPAMARSRLGLLEARAGRPQQADALLREALPVLERSLGPDHPWTLLSRVTLANLREAAGDLKQAEAIERETLAAVERTQQTGTMLEATLLNNLADIYRQRNDLDAAEPLFRRSLAIARTLQGEDTLFVSTALQNLGIIARERKDYAGAVDDYTRALAIRERLVGPDHPTLGGLLNNLATVYRASGDDARALEMHFRALHLWEATLGSYSREVLLSVGNIARTYAGAGDAANALAFQRRADAILETQIELYIAGGSERQKLLFVRSVSERTDRTLSLHLNQAAGDPEAARLAATVLLQRKGRVQDAMTDVFAAVRQRVTDAADRTLMDQWKDTTSRLARMVLIGARTSEAHDAVSRAEGEKERLEATLSEHSAEFRAQMQPVTLEAVQAAMPADAVLIEYAVFRPFDPEAERNEEAYGPSHYAAYVIHKHGAPAGTDLGAVEDIDPFILRMRDAVRDPEGDAKVRARALDDRVMRPLRALFAGATRVLISPDGALNLVPFDALIDEHGRYLIERYATSYLTSGRDLLRMQIARGVPGRPVIVAEPLFGEPGGGGRRRPASPLARRGVTGGADMASLYFPRCRAVVRKDAPSRRSSLTRSCSRAVTRPRPRWKT